MNLSRRAWQRSWFGSAICFILIVFTACPASLLAGSESPQVLRDAAYTSGEHDENAEKQDAPAQEPQPTREKSSHDRHMYGILPNFRTANRDEPFQPLTAKEKFKLSATETLDWSTPVIAGIFAGAGQLQNQNPSFGQGTAGFTRRFAGAYADQAIGNTFAGGIFPSLLHEDPRYFWKGTGSRWSRTGYALSRIFVTRTDSGGSRFNTSEILGNALAAGVSNAYYPDGRDIQDNVVKFSSQLATDAFTSVLKEFWPDIKRHLHRQKDDLQVTPADH